MSGFATLAGQVVGCTLEGLATHPGMLDAASRATWMQFCDHGHWGDRPSRGLNAARALTGQAPGFAPGWATLAQMADILEKLDPAAAWPALHAEGLAAARRAVALDPGSSEARATLVALMPFEDAAARERMLREAIATARPERCRCAQQMLGDFLLQAGRLREAAANYEVAVDSDTGSPLAIWRTAQGAYLVGRPAAGTAGWRGWRRCGADAATSPPAI